MQKTRLALLFFIFLFLFISPISAHAMAVNITAFADSYVSEHYPTTNYGYTQNVLVTSSNNTTYNAGARYGYFMFNLSIIPSNAIISNATFNIKQQIGTDGTFNFLIYNTSLAWNETNLTWATKPANSVLQKNFSRVVASGADWWYGYEVTNAVQSAIATGQVSLMLRYNLANTTLYDLAFYNRSLVYPEYLTIQFTLSGTTCNTTKLGSYCDPADSKKEGGTGRGIVTTPDYTCTNDAYYVCPEGSLCTQITPINNVTNGLVTDSITCEACWFRSDFNYFTNTWDVYSTNCPNNPECNNCNYPSFPSIGNTGWQPRGALCVGNNLIASDVTGIPTSANYYTAGCVNGAGRLIDVIDQYGTHTNITALTQTIWNTTEYNYTLICPSNTTTNCFIQPDCVRVLCSGQESCTKINSSSTCWDKFCNQVSCATPPPQASGTCESNVGGQSALAIGGLMGITNCGLAQTLIAMIVSMAVGFALLFYTRNDGHGGQAFIFGTLISLVMFTVIGWFYSWLMVIIIVIGGYIVAKSLGLGGG